MAKNAMGGPGLRNAMGGPGLRNAMGGPGSSGSGVVWLHVIAICAWIVYFVAKLTSR